MDGKSSHKRPATWLPADTAQDALACSMQFAWSSPDELRAAVADWADLAENAASPNAYYAPGFILAHIDSIGWDDRVQCASVWHTDGEHRRLAALAFLYRDDRRWGWPVRTWRSWADTYFLKFEPLYRRETAGAAARVLYAGLSNNGRQTALLFNRGEVMGCEGPTSELTHTKPDQCTVHVIHGDARAALFARQDVDAYMATQTSKKFRANAERNRRRLADLGSLAFTTVRSAPEVRAAVDDLMLLELAGWKGHQGTALASCPKNKAFALSALRAGQNPLISCDVLSLDGKAIAVSANLVSGGWMFGFKSAFDETLKKHSPGSVLHYLGTRAILEDKTIVAADSTCVPGHPLESVWRDRVRFASTIRSIGAPISAPRLKYVLQTETVRNSAKSTAKTIYYTASNKKATTTKR